MADKIIEGNKIIAVFDNKEAGYDEHGVWKELNYHSDWNLLMPVYRKLALLFKEQHISTNKSGFPQYPTDGNRNLINLNNGFSNYCFQNDVNKAFYLIVSFITLYQTSKS